MQARRHSLRLLAITAIAVATLSGCTTVKNLFGGRSGDKAHEPVKLEAITPSVTVNQLWTANVGTGEKYLGMGQHPVIENGTVYAAAVVGGVHAYELSSGRELWAYASDLKLTGGPGAGDGLVVVGGLQGDVIALDAATGQEKWKAKVQNEVLSAPVIGAGMVYVHSNDGRVTAFDETNGERRWFYESELPPLTVRGTSSLTMGPGLVFFGTDGGKLVALRASDGNVLWSTPVAEPDGRTELERMSDVDGEPVLDGTTLFATSFKNHTVAINGPSGQIMWDSEHGGARGLGVSNSAIVITDPKSYVNGLDKNTGSSLWQQTGLLNRRVTAPAVQGDYAVVGDFEGVIHWLRLSDGAFAARSKLGTAISGKPVVADGIVVIQSSDGKLAAFSLQ
ncbi:outer membrane protein assembly factor BamB [Thermomonas sp.]|uniref:outer membrane protein assembly factor BamB n=1 Tax=Thermomonas sp. TaxID=1971895 RepID=UPI00262C7281|nr:outer membrane protein assembly factor BamB [Thermomonas sp.]MCO5055705.1 outer membrane protein assembly factor BamB [Thermomonas sp.]HRO63518.1 outer membrane protein assembly factor BamB [Thermomonas sp.]